MSQPRAAYNIPNNISDNRTIIAGYTTKDFGALITPVLFSAFIAVNLPTTLSALMIPLIAGGAATSAGIYLFSPNHIGPAEWLGRIGHYIMKPSEVPHISIATPDDSEESTPETAIYEMNTRTQNETQVKEIHKGAGGIERVDGTVVGAIKVEPANMALATQQDWQRMTDDWQGYLNNSVDYPIQIFATSRSFPIDDYVRTYQKRLSDPDMESRPVLRAVTERFINWYPRYLETRGTNQRDYYIIITVTEDEIYRKNTSSSETMADQFANLPVIGRFFERFTKDEDIEESVLKREQFSELHDRIDTAMRGVQRIEDCSAHRITAAEHAVVLKEYWEGVEYNFSENAVSDSPVTTQGEPVTSDEQTELQDTN